ncbi:hypothetical protein ACFXHD_09850 [Streptomyces hydrogenans]|uniref:hypothetical protein n=1 Tax=Streptomyces hydrogenans TaxID=1873719 RepID=UPI0036A43BAD
MDRIYMSRIDGQRRIHVEITDSEVSDLLEDLRPVPEHYDSTRAFLAVLDAAEEIFSPVVAEGRRDRVARTAAARQATGQDNEPVVAYWNDFPRSTLFCREHGQGRPNLIPRTSDDLPFGGICVTCGRDVLSPAGQPDPTTADDPTPLRWGLGDVLRGDDDTFIVCLSGPGPDYLAYWVAFDAERAAAIRDDLTPPAVGQPAAAHGTEGRPSREPWPVEGNDVSRTRQLILNCLTGRAVCGVPRPVDEATGLLDAFRAAVLHEAANAIDAEAATGDLNADEYGTHENVLEASALLRRMAEEGRP